MSPCNLKETSIPSSLQYEALQLSILPVFSLNYLFALLHSLQSKSLISKESWAHSLGAHLSVPGGLLDSVSVSLLVLVVVGVVLRLGHLN